MVCLTYCLKPQVSDCWLGISTTMDTFYCGDPLMGVSISIAVIQCVLVATRFYTRHLQRLKCTWDDYLMIPALVVTRYPFLGRLLLTLVDADFESRTVGIVYSVYVAMLIPQTYQTDRGSAQGCRTGISSGICSTNAREACCATEGCPAPNC
ncbi:hypothetical protein BDV19DRAFT_213420 [Aspergillus venezuelensis]